MRLFVLITFWIHVLAFVIKIFTLVIAEYPRKETKTVGSDTAGALIMLSIGIWAALVLWIA